MFSSFRKAISSKMAGIEISRISGLITCIFAHCNAMAITSFNIRFQRMAFHFEEQIQILFSSLKLTDKNQLVTACVIFALLAFFNESLKLARAKIQIKMKPKQFLNVTCTQKIFNGWHFFQTILHCLQVRKNNL